VKGNEKIFFSYLPTGPVVGAAAAAFLLVALAEEAAAAAAAATEAPAAALGLGPPAPPPLRALLLGPLSLGARLMRLTTLRMIGHCCEEKRY